MRPELLYDPLAPAFRLDPYPALHRLRREDPIHWSQLGYCWILTRHEDIRMVLSDRRFGIGMERMLNNPYLAAVLAEPYNVIIRTQILAADPPDHTRIRGLLTKTFAAPQIEAMRPLIQRVVNELIDAALPRRRLDLIADFARPLPFTVICEILGIPLDERHPLEGYTRGLMRTTDPTPMSRAESDAANAAAIGFRDYFLDLVRRRRAAPTPDLYSELVASIDRGELTEEEFVANMILVFCAGHDTVINLFGNGMLALYRNPRQLELLREEPALVRGAIEELLRYDTTLQIARRTAFEELELGGRRIAVGDYLLCCLGAANRDPAVYPEPDRLDVRRRNVKPLSFGGGIHYCLGAQLARVEGEIGIQTLLSRLPELDLETLEPEWKQNVYIRGVSALHATF